jgi:hypothetical protein
MEKREIALTVSLIMDGAQQMRFDLRPGEQWENGAPGSYRLYRDRCVPIDDPDGQPLFVTLDRAFAIMAGILCGGADISPKPDLPVGTLMRPRTYSEGHMSHRMYTRSEPWRGWDGLWYVQVHVYGRGNIMMPVHLLEPVPLKTPKLLEK